MLQVTSDSKLHTSDFSKLFHLKWAPSNQLREKLFIESLSFPSSIDLPDPHFAYKPTVKGSEREGSQTVKPLYKVLVEEESLYTVLDEKSDKENTYIGKYIAINIIS